jgi:DNA-binding NarL/FixJ family response regulator
VEAFRLGARGVVMKESTTTFLRKSIDAVMSGEYLFNTEKVSNPAQWLEDLRRKEEKKTFGLTPRELEIVSAVVAGWSNKEIAKYFKLNKDSVEQHLIDIYEKVGVSTRLELALFAVNSQLPLKSIV